MYIFIGLAIDTVGKQFQYFFFVSFVGSQDKADEPSGIALRSGDCIIMGGKSRQCYHG